MFLNNLKNGELKKWVEKWNIEFPSPSAIKLFATKFCQILHNLNINQNL